MLDIFAAALYRPVSHETLLRFVQDSAVGRLDGSSLANSMLLPADVGGPDALESLARMGIVPVGDALNFWRRYKVPEGWRLEREAHRTYSHLVDADGHRRAILVVDHGFGGRWGKVRMALIGRFHVYVDYHKNNDGFTMQVRDRDTDGIAFAGKPFDAACGERYDLALGRNLAEATAWLGSNYPQWRDPAAYRKTLLPRHAALISTAAQHVIRGTSSGLDLFPLAGEKMDEIFAAIAEQVAKQSGGEFRMERHPDPKTFRFLIQGPAAYCLRVYASDGTWCKFTLGPYSNGLEFE